MKRNILRAAIAASIFGFSGAAFAQSVDVPFSGTVANACTITKTSDGVLALSGTNRLSSDATGGTRGVVEVICAGTGVLSVATPVATGTTTINGVTEAEIRDSATGSGVLAADPSQGGSTHAHPAGTTSYYVSMNDGGGPDFGAGTYTYTVAVTITAD